MIHDILRKLAKSDKYQILYNRAKDIHGINLFLNKEDFTYIQIMFLHWLNIYSSLYMDLVRGEQYISQEVINNPTRTDAYLIYKHKMMKKQREEERHPNKKKKERAPAPDMPKIIFTNRGQE